MPRKKKEEKPREPRPNDHWVYSLEIQVNGRNLVAGTEVSIFNQRGRFIFIHHVDTGEVQWIRVQDKNRVNRHFYPQQIKTVHYTKKTTQGMVDEYNKNKKMSKEQN